jgi:hypothetical protein
LEGFLLNIGGILVFNPCLQSDQRAKKLIFNKSSISNPMKTVSKILVSICCAIALQAKATTGVGLQQATATFSQTFTGDFSVGRAINGTTADGLGWAIEPQEGHNQTAAFETTANVGFAGGSLLTFTLNHDYAVWGGHMLGRFRLSVTTDDRSTFCDGLPTGGDVTANWIVLDPLSFSATSGATMSELADHSLLVSGVLQNTDIYTITAPTTLTGITGIRLEALTDPSLPFGGPGRQPDNGNFVLSEFSVGIDVIPEPSACALLATGFFLWLNRRRITAQPKR